MNSRAKRNSDLPPWIDIAIRIALGCFFAYGAGVYFRNAIAYMRMAGPQPRLEMAADLLSILALGFFFLFVACLYAVRLRPLNKFAGVGPAVIAVGGAFLVCGLMLMHPRMDLPVGVKITAACLIFIGNAFGILSLRHLGRSFSILPEARKLVTTGPYHYIRHPLYLAEIASTLGALINFLSPAAAALVFVQFALQFARMHFEEKVLRETFPGYAAYSRRTARLIPGIY